MRGFRNTVKGLSLALALAGAFAFTGCEKRDGGNAQGTGGGASSGDSGSSNRARQVHKAPDGATIKLAFVTNNPSDFWRIAQAGVKKYEREGNVKVDIQMPPNGKAEEQNQMLENLVSQGYHGIAVSAIAPKDQVPQLNRAARQTNVITHDSDAPTANRLVYIGTDNIQAGRVLGEQIVKLLPQGGKMAVFVGTLSADNARQRLDGIKEVIKDKNIQIVAEKEDQTDRTMARSNVENVINAFPDIKLMCGLWSYNGPAIAAALDATGKKGQILAAVFDEEDLTLAGIENGTIQVTCVQKPFEFGYQSSKLLHALATKGDEALPKDDKIDTGVEIITKENVGAFKTRLDEMRSQGK